MIKKLKNISMLAVMLTAIIFGIAITNKYVIEYEARKVARSFVDSIREPSMTEGSLLVALTRAVHQAFKGGSEYDKRPIIYILRPYLTHGLLPSFLRVEPGAIDTMYVKGFCDSAARTLAFILESVEIKAWQLNIVTREGSGHVVTLAQLSNGQEVMLDPLLGVVPKQHDRLIGPEEAQLLTVEGVPMSTLWQSLAPSSNDEFYSNFSNAVFARQGHALNIDIDIDLGTNNIVTLGKLDSDYGDVGVAGMRNAWTAYLHYLGNRYDRGWIRSLYFPQATKVTFTLINTPRKGVVTSDLQPEILGNSVIYHVSAGETLNLIDGRAERDWLSLRSYQNVDVVRFERISHGD